jgi:hypothetical protein
VSLTHPHTHTTAHRRPYPPPRPQPHTRWFTNAHLAGLLSPNSSLLCAPRGAVTGTHPRLFVNRGDAWMFRSNAYAYAHVEDLGLQPHPHHPPRKITVLLRKGKGGRNFENLAGLMAVVNATGLPVEYIDDMGRFTFKQQVRSGRARRKEGGQSQR